MARLSGIELKDNWRIDYALTQLKGIGWFLAEEVLKKASVEANKRVANITTEELAAIATALEGYVIEGDLSRVVRSNVSRLQAIGSYRGMRHSRGLPARGQRTKSNARAKRGKRKTVGAFRKEALAKMQSDK